MAARFWVGGSGTWSTTNTTNWSATSGGAGGASVPTAADDVTIDANSGSPTVTTNYNASVISVTINAAAATLSLGGSLTCSGLITLTTGTFTTNNNNVTAVSFLSNNSNVRTINFGSSTIALSNTLQFTTATNLTFNAGTSQINLSNSALAFQGGGQTFYNVSFTSTAATNLSIGGANTFNNLTVTAPASAGVAPLSFENRQTINGTLSTTGTAGNRRVWFRSNTYGIAQTLTINSAPSLTDADFRDIYVIGTAAPISGTRIGDLRGCRGITFDAPKTVYWNLAGGGNWSANAWAATSGGAVSTDNFPLAQDTAVIENTGLNTSATVTLDAGIVYVGTIDMSTRTNAMTLAGSTTYAFYGDFVFGSGVTRSYSGTLQFSGRNTQTITSAGKVFNNNFSIDTYGGTVELADALNIQLGTLTVTNGTFDTKNYNVTAGSLSSSNSNVRTINLGSSTVTASGISAVDFTTNTNLTFNAGTSSIISSGTSATSVNGGSSAGAGVTFYNVTFSSTSANTKQIVAANTFNNLTITAPASAGLMLCTFSANQTITGTLTVAGASPIRRIFVLSNSLGTTRTLTVNSLSAQDCDFRDITIAGTAAGSSPTRAGDCGGNTGITFPAAKTVYWNLAGTQSWSATAWAPSSGGTPDINKFPLAQDTAVFDDTGAVGTVQFQTFNIGTIDASARTSAMTLSYNATSSIYGNYTLGSGVTTTNANGHTFSGRGTQTITSAGKTLSFPITIDCATGTVQLADALTLNSARALSLTTGTFDAVTYNVTVGRFAENGGVKTLRMGSGTWTLSGTGNVWDILASTFTFFKGTANIVLSDTSTTARSFLGVNLSYNKLTIGGATGTSTLTITGNNQFTELASTKTVAHTIALGTTTQTFGAWTVTGTVGNVVTLTGTGTSHILAGACTDGIDYLAMGSIGFAATSPGEFYAGANSTGTAAAPVYRTAKPADSTRYWVGGTGNWSDTARWSTGSGGAGGASVPRSHDDVVFDSASNATAYTATVNAVTGGIRCKALTIAGPASGNLTLAGSTAIVGIHGDVTLPATGLTRTYSGAIYLSGSTTGKTITTNGISLGNDTVLNGIGCEWSLGSAIIMGGGTNFQIQNGSLNTANYSCTMARFYVIPAIKGNSCSLTLGSSIITELTAGFTVTANGTGFILDAGTSTINFSGSSGGVSNNTANTLVFNDYNYTNTGISTASIIGANTFNNLTVAGRTSAGITNITLSANQTINGTLTLSAGTNATMRTFLRSDTIGTTRTLTCAAFSGTDADFRDITIAGAAAPVSGTRLGDCKGNSGITFTAAANKYWNLAAGGNWGGAIGWATSSGGTPAINNFPLAQDTCFFESTGLNSGATVTINAGYNIGTIDMSDRTSNTIILSTGSTTPTIYGNWINGTGTTLSGTGILTFAGRGSQTITSSGVTFTQPVFVNTPSGLVTLQDAFVVSASGGFGVSAGTFDAANFNVTLVVGGPSGNAVKAINIGSGTWTMTGTGSAWSVGAGGVNFTVTGTGTISLTSASTKTFAGGGLSYSGITLNQGGAGALTITGNNTFANISNTYSATGATTIAMGTTTQRVANFTASGEAGRVLTVQGTSASSPATLVFTGSGQATTPTTDYLTITGVRAYSLDTTWYAGANSTNNGSLGWYFEAGGGGPIAVYIIESATGNSSEAAAGTLNSTISELSTGSEAASASAVLLGTLSESVSIADAIAAARAFYSEVAEATTAADVVSAARTLAAAIISESAQGQEAVVAQVILNSLVADSATMSDSVAGGLSFTGSVAEAAAAAESISAIQSFYAAIAEATTSSDVVSAAFTVAGSIAEQLNISEAAAAALVLNSLVAESAVVADEASRAMLFIGSVSELAAAAETVLSGATLTGRLTETATPADAAAVLASTFSASAAETTLAQDLLNAPGSIYSTGVAEAATAMDVMLGAYLWNDIPDTSESYSGIADTPATWSLISDVSETYTLVGDTATTWSTIADNSETWNPED